MIAFTAGFGLIIGKPAVIALCAGAICLIFLIVKATGSPINGDTKITRRNKVAATKLKRTGRKARHTTIHLIMAEDTVPQAYIQTNKFLVYHSYGLSFIDTITPHNYRLLEGREVEITYMACNGYVIGLKILDYETL